MPPDTRTLREISVQLGQLVQQGAANADSLRTLTTSVNSLASRVEKLEAQQTGSTLNTDKTLDRLEKDYHRLNDDFLEFKDQLVERDRIEQRTRAAADKAEALEAGQERGVNKTQWAILIAIGGAALLVLGDIILRAIAPRAPTAISTPAQNMSIEPEDDRSLRP